MTPFAPGATEEIWVPPIVVVAPATVRVDEDEVVVNCAPERAADTIYLACPSGALTADLARDLAEQLLTITGVRPRELGLNQHRVVEVPVRSPDAFDDWSVTWVVRPSLSVQHIDRTDAALSFPGESDAVALATASCWDLVCALASLYHWQGHLQGLFAQTASDARLGRPS